MPLPMFGTSRATVEQVNAVSIHGDIYYDLSLRLEGAEPQPARLPQHLLMRPPQVADTLDLTFLMGQVSEARFVDHPH